MVFFLKEKVEPLRRRSLVQRKLYNFINTSAFNVPLALLIVLSVVLIFAEFFVPPGDTLVQVQLANDIITLIFVVELSLRAWVAPSRRIFLKNYWLDILSVLPILRVVRAVRILRLLRLLRLGRALVIMLRHGGWLSERMERYFGSIGVILFVSMVLVVSATLTSLSFDTEKQTYVSPQEFVHRSLDISLLFATGEVSGDGPGTLTHKILNLLVSLAGLVVFAVLVGTIAASMSNYLKSQMETKEIDIDDLNGHLLICGWHRMGAMILRQLMEIEELWQRGVVVVTEADEHIESYLPANKTGRLFHVKADYTRFDVLEHCGAQSARRAIVLADRDANLRDQDKDARTVLAALTLEKLNPEIFTCAELLDEQNATHLELAGVEEIISHSALTAGVLVSSAANTGMGSTVKEVLSWGGKNGLKKQPVPENLIGKSFLDAFLHFKEQHAATIIAVDTNISKGAKHIVNPSADLILGADDTLVLLAASAK